MGLWFESIHRYDIATRRIQGETINWTTEASHIGRGILRRIEKTNVKRSYVIDGLVKDIDSKGRVNHWP